MPSFLKIAGDYHNWNVYKKSVIVCDVTEMFIRKYYDSRSRTVDQMRQAARSCKQNIVEGITDRTISYEMCIKLIGVAKGSLRELQEDYEDYLRQNRFEIWSKEDNRVIATRRFCVNNDDSKLFVDKCEERSPETVANIMLTVIHQLDSMLAKLLKIIEQQFLQTGGIKENMAAARREVRHF